MKEVHEGVHDLQQQMRDLAKMMQGGGKMMLNLGGGKSPAVGDYASRGLRDTHLNIADHAILPRNGDLSEMMRPDRNSMTRISLRNSSSTSRQRDFFDDDKLSWSKDVVLVVEQQTEDDFFLRFGLANLVPKEFFLEEDGQGQSDVVVEQDHENINESSSAEAELHVEHADGWDEDDVSEHSSPDSLQDSQHHAAVISDSAATSPEETANPLSEDSQAERTIEEEEDDEDSEYEEEEEVEENEQTSEAADEELDESELIQKLRNKSNFYGNSVEKLRAETVTKKNNGTYIDLAFQHGTVVPPDEGVSLSSRRQDSSLFASVA